MGGASIPEQSFLSSLLMRRAEFSVVTLEQQSCEALNWLTRHVRSVTRLLRAYPNALAPEQEWFDWFRSVSHPQLMVEQVN